MKTPDTTSLKGIFTALVTPFNEKGEVDTQTLISLAKRQIESGVNGLVLLGTTAEAATLSFEEKAKIVALVAEHSQKKVPLIVGAGSNNTKEALRLTHMAHQEGADFTLQVSPYYNKPTQEGLFIHFRTLADEGALPLILYNIKGRTGVNIETKTLMRLADHDRIQGVKEASGDLHQVMEVLAHRPSGFSVLSGDDALTFPMMTLGADGVIAVTSNLVPKLLCQMVEALLDGKTARAREIHFALLPLFNALFWETNPIPLKHLMSVEGLLEEVFRLPLCKPSKKTCSSLDHFLKNWLAEQKGALEGK